MSIPDRLDLRVMSACLGLLSLALAYGLGIFTTDGLGHCLQVAAAAPAHCPLCYLGAALLAVAVLPWPRRRASTSA